jgi:hypothetical protein
MNEPLDVKFVDHPAPGIGLMTLMILVTMSFIVTIPFVLRIPPGEKPSWLVPTIVPVLILFIAILCYSFWLLYSAYYIVTKKGIMVKYGPSTNTYQWEEFRTVYWRKGMFTTKIGWPSVTPCVRLSNAVALPLKNKRWALYLTPNDPKAFIEKITLFAPELTKEVIM